MRQEMRLAAGGHHCAHARAAGTRDARRESESGPDQLALSAGRRTAGAMDLHAAVQAAGIGQSGL